MLGLADGGEVEWFSAIGHIRVGGDTSNADNDQPGYWYPEHRLPPCSASSQAYRIRLGAHITNCQNHPNTHVTISRMTLGSQPGGDSPSGPPPMSITR